MSGVMSVAPTLCDAHTWIPSSSQGRPLNLQPACTDAQLQHQQQVCARAAAGSPLQRGMQTARAWVVAPVQSTSFWRSPTPSGNHNISKHHQVILRISVPLHPGRGHVLVMQGRTIIAAESGLDPSLEEGMAVSINLRGPCLLTQSQLLQMTLDQHFDLNKVGMPRCEGHVPTFTLGDQACS